MKFLSDWLQFILGTSTGRTGRAFMNARSIILSCFGFLFAICGIALIPLAVLIYEFGFQPFCGEAVWSYVAKLYGSYFLFPIFGVLVAGFLALPLAVMLMIVREYRGWMISIVGFCIFFTLAMSAIEFLGSPYAVFEVKPESFLSPMGKPVFERLATICTPESFAYRGRFDSYQTDLQTLIHSGRSISGYIYYFAIPAQVALHSILLSVFLLILYFKKPFIENFLEKRGFKILRANFFLCFGLALTLGAVWCIYRLSYRFDHSTAFGGWNQTSKLHVDFLILGLYSIVIAVYFVFAGLDLEKTAKTISQMLAFVGVIGFSAAAPQGYASFFFGTKASLFNFVGMLVFLLILLSLGLLIGAPPPPVGALPASGHKPKVRKR